LRLNLRKTLVAYGTRQGATARSANIIVEILKRKFLLEVDVVDLKENRKFSPNPYNNIVIGSSINIGKWTLEATRFLRSDFTGKKVAIFVSAGDSMQHFRYTNSKAVLDKAISLYIDRQMKWYKVKPFSKKILGGIVKVNGKTTIDSWNREEVEEWAMELGKNFVNNN
jgi:menaquinone-dependent protoporphyrinogen IX oxidase